MESERSPTGQSESIKEKDKLLEAKDKALDDKDKLITHLRQKLESQK